MNIEKRKVLITGATGCIGSNLLDRCLNKGYDVNILIRRVELCDKKFIGQENPKIFIGDINDKNILEEASAGCEIIFHLAAKVHSYEDKPFADYDAFDMVNVYGTKNLLDANIKNQSLNKFIFFSSAGLNKEVSNTSYLKSKLNAEKLCSEYIYK